jgi:hypothetical protein
MRKMIPNASGSSVQATWTNGGTQVFDFTVAVPSYIYDLSELGVIAFVQNNTSKEVLNAGKNNPIPFAVDARANNVTNLPAITCASTISATVNFKNNGTNPLTAANLEVRVDGNLVTTFNWTGNLAAGASTSQVITGIPAGSAGTHDISITVVATGDNNGVNNTKSGSYAVASSPVAAPLTQGFPTSTFPPANWARENPDGGATWTRNSNGGFQASAGSAKMDFYNSPADEEDVLYAPKVNLVNAAHNNARLTFSHAYATYQNEADALTVEVSTDCGASWTTVWFKSGTQLSTAPAQTASFTPSAANQWVRDTASLAVVFGEADVLVRFLATSAYGNNLYIDDINIETFITPTVGVNEVFHAETINLYPNPATSASSLKFGLVQAADVQVQVVNALGQVVLSQNPGRMGVGIHTIDLNVNNLPNGTYFVKLAAGNALETRTMIVNR